MERSKVGGLRLVTAVELLESLRVPAVAVDNTTAAICWRNAAFKELQASFDEGISNSKDPKASDNSKSDADFLAVLKDAPSGSSRRPTSVTWRGTDVAVAWEGSVQGDSSRNEDNEKPEQSGHENGAGPASQAGMSRSDGQCAEASNSSKDWAPARKAVKPLIYLPLLGKRNDAILTSKAAPTDQGLDKDSELDVQLERSVWQCLLKEIPAACLIMDTHGSVRFASRTIAEIFRTENTGADWSEVSSLPKGCEGYFEGGSIMRDQDYPLYRTVRNNEIVRGAEIRIKRADGTYGGIRSTSSPIYDNAGEVVAYVAVIEDVSSTYDARQERDALHAKHEAVKRANKLKDEFINSISHELRTPLNGLLGLQDLLAGEADRTARDRYLRQVFDLTEKLKIVIDDLLACTLQEGRLEPEIAPHNMETMIREVIALLHNSALHKRVKVTVRPPVEANFPIEVLTDEREFKNVMYRLLDNAIKFSEEDSEVDISLQLQEQDSVFYVVARVSDNGCGIEVTANIFEAFTQGTNSISKTQSGLGLGLSYVWNAMKRLEGTIDVSSEVGKGTIFSLYFKLALPPTAIRPTSAPPLKSTQRAFTDRKADIASRSNKSSGVTCEGIESAIKNVHSEVASLPTDMKASHGPEKAVLIVEDDPINAKILERTFAKAGCEVVLAVNGQAGFEEAQKRRFHVIIMDINMPVLNGIESTKLIRQTESKLAHPPAAIIGFTANTAARFLDDGIAAGMTFVLTKPRSGKQVLEAVQQYF